MFISVASELDAKVLLCTYSYNRPDFIELQAQTFKKFLQDDYELIVFNDARDKKMCMQIEQTCKKLVLRCVRIPQEIHGRPYLPRAMGDDFYAPSVKNCNVVQYSLDQIGFGHDDIVALFDSDLFLIKDFSIREYMRGYGIAGLAQSREHVNYLWIGLAFLDIPHLPARNTINFNCGNIDGIGVDAGGFTHFYLKNNPGVQVRYGDVVYPQDLLPRAIELAAHDRFYGHIVRLINAGAANMECMFDCTFLHYRAGSNWDNQSAVYHRQKTQVLLDFVRAITR